MRAVPVPGGRAGEMLALAVVLVLAVSLRLSGLHWDAHVRHEGGRPPSVEEQHLHPDERFLTMVTTALELPSSWRGYFDTGTATMNPHNRGFGFFPYGTLPIFVVKVAGAWLGRAGYDQIHVVGRLLSAFADLVVVLLTVVLGRQLYGSAVGLLGGLLMATAVLPIQQAHFYVVDTFANAFVMLGLLAVVRLQREGSLGASLGLGFALGAGLACKLSIFPLGLLAAAATVIRVLRPPAPGEGRRTMARRLAEAGADLALAAAVTFLVFRLFQPYAFHGPGFLDVAINPAWLANMREVLELVSGLRDIPPGHQWTDRIPLWFPWTNMVLFGLGPCLGLAAWAGWALAAWELWRRPRRWEHLVPWAWVLIVFLHQGTQWVMSMRYLLPIYPVLCLLAAYVLVRVWRWAAASPGRPRWREALALALGGAVIAGTLGWAWAFTAIYRQPHSRIEASRWIYARVPAGAVLAVEHWDDALPLRIDGKDGATIYRSVELPNYAEDTPEKLELILDVLGLADYVILSSNRLVDSIPRLPMRYPMTTLYYRHLLGGDLGFQPVAEFIAYPTILGLAIPDQGAEEAFSVYDHPRVRVFAKTAAWSRENARALLGRIDWDNIEKLSPRAASEVKSRLRLPPERLASQRGEGTWSRALEPAVGLFDPGGVGNQIPVLVWIAVLLMLGVAAFPLTATALGTFGDRGWLLAKTVGLLIVAVGGWLLASVGGARFTPATCAAVVAGLALTSGWLAWQRRRDLRELWQTRRWLLASEELLFWTAFGAFLLIRWQNPDLWHPSRGGEKPMELAYLNATLKSDAFPPFDPWFAGGYINYYYFGFVLVATLVKLTGVVPAVAYNLAIPTFFALTVGGAFTVTASLVQAVTAGKRPAARRIFHQSYPFIWGILGALFVAVIGNLYEIRLVLDSLYRLSPLDFATRIPFLLPVARVLHGSVLALTEQRPIDLPHEWYWNATRVIPHPTTEPSAITEFPFFTFLFADLHPHLMALPYTLLVLALVIHLIRHGPSRPVDVQEWATLGLLAVTTGVLWPLNAWDFPTYVLLAAIGLVLRELRADRSLDRRALWAAAWRILFVIALGRLLFHPFFVHFANAYGGVAPWHGSRTPPSAFVTIHGLFLFIFVTYVVVALRRTSFPSRNARRGLVIGSLLALLLTLAGSGTSALLLALGALTLALLISPSRSPAERLLCVLILLGGGLSLGVEHVVLTGDVGRMNTVFKSYLQIWVLWGVAAAAALVETVRLWPQGKLASRLKAAWAGTVVLLLAATCLYPLLATPARIRDRFDPSLGPGLDGEAFMRRAIVADHGAQIALHWDAEAMRWLRDHVAGSPVIVEASVPPYRWGSRVSTYTGLPTVVGWEWHQRQQRAALTTDPVGRRLEHVRAIYAAPDAEAVLPILQRYRAEYVYVGPLERLYYPGVGLEKFEAARAHFRLVYENPEVRIFQVIARSSVVQHEARPR
jgi:YYY domain-containing protein